MFKILALLTLVLSFGKATPLNSSIDSSIVKIYTVSKATNYLEPWNSSVGRSSGSGSIIAGNRILTNAHVIANETFIEVKKYGDTKRYQARVLEVSHDTDLALLEVENKDFFKDTVPLEFGILPKMQDKVTVYGYPMGGHTISVSTGIVSRIEHNRYAHSGKRFLAIQIDAAINPGNSGGPTISNGKIVGVVMQGITFSQNIGYMVPVDIIQHFLKDVEDGRRDGFPKLGIMTDKIENPSLKKYYKLEEDAGGILVVDIVHNSILKDVLKKEDIITAIDGHKIESDGTVEFRKNQYTHFKYFIDLHQYGDTVSLEVLRDGKKVCLTAVLPKEPSIVQSTYSQLEYDKMPTYFMLGGYVFSPLTENLLNSSTSPVLGLRYAATKFPKKEKQELVVLLKVLASSHSRGDYGISMWHIQKVNGKEFKNFKEFYDLVINTKEKFVILEDEDGAKVVIDKAEALASEKELLKRYSIKANKSDDM
ncbi:MAG: serine protease; identified by sequence similarity; putative; ORF located using Blastx/Glimmer [uncultured Sulfurovum sp.]|uniref:Serine protease identified by sequence similarity putative ORF located using Blastx/Glimmer n=1 Tax=uncultured Sulfurovum sp. TaxID=269237 RepID=A0A6S6TBJ1_9BACT|nr:MAG: serine protease; identified by sequence similarity; putative; ORF located using Blastx/Glimmer [uncultured Sulfurovum sp.]